ncbi:MAG: amino acid permease [Bacteroidetes bacterium]|nr:amino acid permease [Bacteroidota bacterium]MBS1630009.1 amino acid permease [Bacteroidota bacterium]
MRRVLGVRDLAALGVAAIIGAGIFSTVGKSCFFGGPAVIFLFIITAVTCGFSALCYAEFAARIPVSGSAYTYSYASFGELIAWIIGWDLIMEYAIGNIVVAASWSSNLVSFLDNLSAGINQRMPGLHLSLHIPDWLATPWRGAWLAHQEVIRNAAQGNASDAATMALSRLWETAPHIGSVPIILNVPALIITALITWLIFIGIQETRRMSNAMVVFKLLVIVAVIAVGFFYVNANNWSPFAPNGFGGVMRGVSAVFFAYIGFDAISTTAEECRNPQRDLPRGMMWALVICTVLYILVALVLTGMVNYKQLNVEDFLASAFAHRGLNWFSGVIALSAVVATTSVMLVFQLGQPRIWMSMSRDGLLPPRFAKLHPRYKTPGFSTLMTGLLVGIPALVLDSDLVTDLTSIGTLFAFALVCGGVLLLPTAEKGTGFRVPYVNGRWIVPLVFVVSMTVVLYTSPHFLRDFFSLQDGGHPEWSQAEVFLERIPHYLLALLIVALVVLSFLKRLSLIPVLGMLSCFYLIAELGIANWLRFFVWLIVGLAIYFLYGKSRSKLALSGEKKQE